MSKAGAARLMAVTWLQAAAFVLLAAEKPSGWSWFSLAMCVLFAAIWFGAAIGIGGDT